MGFPDLCPLIGGRTDIALGYSATSSRHPARCDSSCRMSKVYTTQNRWGRINLFSSIWRNFSTAGFCLRQGPLFQVRFDSWRYGVRFGTLSCALVRFVPVVARSGVDLQPDRQFGGAGHQPGDSVSRQESNSLVATSNTSSSCTCMIILQSGPARRASPARESSRA